MFFQNQLILEANWDDEAKDEHSHLQVSPFSSFKYMVNFKEQSKMHSG